MFNNYLKIAWRNLVKGKLYSGINITGLGLGIASVLLIFLYIQFEFSFDEYHEKKDRIYRVVDLDESGWDIYIPGNPVEEMRTNFSGIENAVRMMNCPGSSLTVGDQNFPDVDIHCTESNLFSIFSFPLLAGSKENVLDAPYTAVISQSTAQRIFGDVNPIGKSIIQNWYGTRTSFEVTGVMQDIPVHALPL